MITVRSLVCRAHVGLAIQCLGSLVRHSQDPLTLALHDDGSLSPDDVHRLQERLPAKVISVQEGESICRDALGPYPHCLKFRATNIFGPKLFDMPIMSRGGDFAYCDADVFFFRPFTGLFAWPSPQTQALFLEDTQSSYALRPWDLWGRGAVELPMCLNAGLMFVRDEAYDLEFVEFFLRRELGSFHRIPLWVEQTCWAALAARKGCRLWSPDQVRVIRDKRCLSADLIGGHFTSNVRSLLPLDDRLEGGRRPTETLLTVASSPLGVVEAASDQVRRAARSRWGIG